LVKRFDLKPAKYYLGGFGDSTLREPKNAFEVTGDQIDLLKKEGWIIC
jgi:hypothetical protein